MSHDVGQVGQVPPQVIQVTGIAVDLDGRGDLASATVGDPGFLFLLSRVDTKLLIQLAMPAHSAVNQRRTGDQADKTQLRLGHQSVGDQAAASKDRTDLLVAADVASAA